ncbi:neurotransmitter symporter family protein, partial [Vibrio parahaemolyticus V-223/04]
FRLWKP